MKTYYYVLQYKIMNYAIPYMMTINRVNKAPGCTCFSHEPETCKRLKHMCICFKNPDECRSYDYHACICKTDSNKCKQNNNYSHYCICDKDSKKCKKTHYYNCIIL